MVGGDPGASAVSTGGVRPRPVDWSNAKRPVAVASGKGEMKTGRRLDSLVADTGVAIADRPVSIAVGPGNPGAGRPLITTGTVPSGFDREGALKRFNDNRGDGFGGVGNGLGTGSGGGASDDDYHDGYKDGYHDGHDDGHDDGYHDGYHDGHHDGHNDHHGGHHGNHHYSGWYVVINDYDHDGYSDWACTNGFYTIWWYGGYSSYVGYGWGYGGYSGYYYGYPYWWHRYPYSYRGPVYGVNQEFNITIEMAADTAEAQVDPGTYTLDAIEVARMLMSAGATGDAVDAYEAHLDLYPDDWIAVRELGVAKMLTGSYLDGVALLHYAYSSDPMLAAQPLGAELFEGSSAVLRDAVVDLVRWGHRNPSAGVWLGVAVLMQAEERDAVAMNMLDRAGQYGLDPAIGDAMRAELVRY